jgi:CDP-paratose 2-epimerase
VYWHGAHDVDLAQNQDDFSLDEREHHFGLRRADGSEKLLFRLLGQGGVDAVEHSSWLGRRNGTRVNKRPIVITGGCGFIGCNLADRLCSEGRPVILYDNLSRPGVERNAQYLREQHGDLVEIEVADTRDAFGLSNRIQKAAAVFHFAAQVAVTSSLSDPIYDFEVNARGTVNLLEALRSLRNPPPIIFTSTNKVYGSLEDVDLRIAENRYEPVDETLRACGISEDQRLDLYSPYGCSKGAADQYILDYARIFGLPAVVFRMSCIYGPHQLGTEDQGWVAHFLINAINHRSITIYGDGKQVRDILFVEDLVEALLLARKNIRTISGQVFNIGGGVENTTSLRELLALIGQLHESKPRVKFANWRPGDQRYYVSNFSKFHTATGWSPRVSTEEGIRRLYDWLRHSHESAGVKVPATA